VCRVSHNDPPFANVSVAHFVVNVNMYVLHALMMNHLAKTCCEQCSSMMLAEPDHVVESRCLVVSATCKISRFYGKIKWALYFTTTYPFFCCKMPRGARPKTAFLCPILRRCAQVFPLRSDSRSVTRTGRQSCVSARVFKVRINYCPSEMIVLPNKAMSYVHMRGCVSHALRKCVILSFSLLR
jgi:hypothetical protein